MKKTKKANPVVKVKRGKEKTIPASKPLTEWRNLIGSGLKTRDLFALAALMGDTTMRSHGDQATRAYMVADAMLKERAKGKLEASVEQEDGSFKRDPSLDRPGP